MFRKSFRRLPTSTAPRAQAAQAVSQPIETYSTRPDPWQSDSLIDIGTRKIFNEDHDALRMKIRKFFNEVPRSRIQQWEDQENVKKYFRNVELYFNLNFHI